MVLLKKKPVINKKPKKWKNEKDWDKLDKYIKKHKLNEEDFQD